MARRRRTRAARPSASRRPSPTCMGTIPSRPASSIGAWPCRHCCSPAPAVCWLSAEAPRRTRPATPSPMASITLKQQEFSTYVQDDWRVLRRLTLSLGLRHELLLNPYEEKNRLSMFDPATGAIVVASDNGVLPTSQYNPAIVARLTDSK